MFNGLGVYWMAARDLVAKYELDLLDDDCIMATYSVWSSSAEYISTSKSDFIGGRTLSVLVEWVM